MTIFHILTQLSELIPFLFVFLGCQLTGKVFYKVEDQALCEADYMVNFKVGELVMNKHDPSL